MIWCRIACDIAKKTVFESMSWRLFENLRKKLSAENKTKNRSDFWGLNHETMKNVIAARCDKKRAPRKGIYQQTPPTETWGAFQIWISSTVFSKHHPSAHEPNKTSLSITFLSWFKHLFAFAIIGWGDTTDVIRHPDFRSSVLCGSKFFRSGAFMNLDFVVSNFPTLVSLSSIPILPLKERFSSQIRSYKC